MLTSCCLGTFPSRAPLARRRRGTSGLSQVLFRKACYVLRGNSLDPGGDLFWRQELRARYDAAADAIHPRRGALQGKEGRALSCSLVRASSSSSTSSSMILPSCSTITLTASSTLPVVEPT